MKAKEDIATKKGSVLTLFMRGVITKREGMIFLEDLVGHSLDSFNVSDGELGQIKDHVNAELLKLGADGRNGRTARGGKP